METTQTTLGQRIKLLRTEYNLSRNQFGGYCDLSHVQVGKLENDEVETPHPGTIESICGAFGTTKEFILSGAGDMLPNGKLKLRPLAKKQDVDGWHAAYIERENRLKDLGREIEGLRQMVAFLSQGKINFPQPLDEAAVIPLQAKEAEVIALSGKAKRKRA